MKRLSPPCCVQVPLGAADAMDPSWGQPLGFVQVRRGPFETSGGGNLPGAARVLALLNGVLGALCQPSKLGGGWMG